MLGRLRGKPEGDDAINPARTVVLVGHCLPDRFMLSSAVRRAVPGARVENVNSGKALSEHLRADAVLLVNRVLDGRFDTESGIDLIREVSRAAEATTTVLISDLPDAQSDAEAAGAHPGFGKTQLYEDRTADILRRTVTPV